MRCAEIEKARLWPISELVVENTDAVPGYYAHPCGYVVFATTIYGDAFCFDTNSLGFPASASVVLIAHDLEPENDQMKRQDLEKLAKPVAVNFEDFLQKFVAGTLDLKPLYPPMDDSTSNPRT